MCGSYLEDEETYQRALFVKMNEHRDLRDEASREDMLNSNRLIVRPMRPIALTSSIITQPRGSFPLLSSVLKIDTIIMLREVDL